MVETPVIGKKNIFEFVLQVSSVLVSVISVQHDRKTLSCTCRFALKMWLCSSFAWPQESPSPRIHHLAKSESFIRAQNLSVQIWHMS